MRDGSAGDSPLLSGFIFPPAAVNACFSSWTEVGRHSLEFLAFLPAVWGALMINPLWLLELHGYCDCLISMGFPCVSWWLLLSAFS